MTTDPPGRQVVLGLAGLTVFALVAGVGVLASGQAEDDSSSAPTPTVTAAPAVTPSGPATVVDATTLRARLVPPTPVLTVTTDTDLLGAAQSTEQGLSRAAGVVFTAAQAFQDGEAVALVTAAQLVSPCVPGTLPQVVQSIGASSVHTDAEVAVGTTRQDGTTAYTAAACTGNTLLLVIAAGGSTTEADAVADARAEVASVAA